LFIAQNPFVRPIFEGFLGAGLSAGHITGFTWGEVAWSSRFGLDIETQGTEANARPEFRGNEQIIHAYDAQS
jgi:hypothetical protein